MSVKCKYLYLHVNRCVIRDTNTNYRLWNVFPFFKNIKNAFNNDRITSIHIHRSSIIIWCGYYYWLVTKTYSVCIVLTCTSLDRPLTINFDANTWLNSVLFRWNSSFFFILHKSAAHRHCTPSSSPRVSTSHRFDR